MTQEERLNTCKLCVNRKFDRTKGLVCGLTMEVPSFVDSCPDYEENPKAVAIEVGRQNFRGGSSRSYSTRLEPASAGKRFGNFFIDRVLINVILFGLISFMVDADLFESGIGLIFFLVALYLGYYCFFEIIMGQTPGKMITGTIVVKEDGSAPDGSSIFIRSISRLIPFEPFSFLGDGVGWHDTLSKTRVVDKSSVKRKEEEDVLDQF